MSNGMRLVQVGLGTIGASCLRLALQRGHSLVAAIDADPAKVGQDVGTAIGLPKTGVMIERELIEDSDPQVALHATGSSLEEVAPQLEGLLRRGIHVISTCEQLSYPWIARPELASRLDTIAKQFDVSLLGTGVNPGFVMDTFPLFAAGACEDVRNATVIRVVDTARRRPQLRKKTGYGLSAAEFTALAAQGDVGHVGLRESAQMLAAGLGWSILETDEVLEPYEGDSSRILGVHQEVVVRSSEGRTVRLDLTMASDVEGERDEVHLDSTPAVHIVLEGGLHGDTSTAAVVVNVMAAIISAPSGLLTMADLVPLKVGWG